MTTKNKEIKKPEAIEIKVDTEHLTKEHKNNRGRLGPQCTYCGGYGYTLSIMTGGSSGCNRCLQTGVEPVNTWELQKQVIDLSKQLVELKDIIIKFTKDV